MSAPGWPARLRDGEVELRPLSRRDGRAWREVRSRNAAWLLPWDATVPPGGPARPPSFAGLVRQLRRAGRRGTSMPFAILVDGHFRGQVTVSNIVRGSAQFASIGYWLDQQVAGRGLAPRAVAVVIDHCFDSAGLHRIEIAVRPENTNSLRLVEKLGIAEIGLAPRYLHIDGDWRDHRIHAITAEEAPAGVRRRLAR